MCYADTKWVTNFRIEGENNDIAAAVLTDLFCFEKKKAREGIPLENKMFYK
jgi:hypothetical protein